MMDEKFWKRFWIKVIKTNNCWEWKAAKNQYGYGQIRINNPYKMVAAHRASYEKFKGKIPDGLVIDHLCSNRACVNPKHLEAVTQKENLLRGDVFKIAANKKRQRTHCKNGHEYTGNNLRVCVLATRSYRLCRACVKASNKKSYMKFRSAT